jgi:hypothetical protein
MNRAAFRFGKVIETGQPLDVAEEELTTHTVRIGRTGSGKSRAVTDHVLQLFDQNSGACVIDPHGDTTEDILGHLANRVVTTGKKNWLKRVHYLEPSPFLCFRYNPCRFFYPKRFHPELLASVKAAWRHAKADRMSEVLQRKQGQSDFEGMPRLQRVLRDVLTAVLTEVHGKRLSLADAEILLDVFHPLHGKVYGKLAPNLPREVVADFEVLHSFKRTEDLRRETESTVNRFRSLFSPLLKAIVDCELGVDLYEIVQKGHLLLANLRETPFFTHDQMLALSGLLIHDIHETMQVTPRELRKPFTLVLEEAGEVMSGDICRWMGAVRKYGLRLELCGQDLSTFRRKDQDFVPKILSQAGIIQCFNQRWPDDAAVLARVLGMGNVEFNWLVQEVERHAGYEWRRVVEYGLNVGRQSSWSDSVGEGESDTASEQDGVADARVQNWAKVKGTANAVGSSDMEGTGATDSSSAGRSEAPILLHGRLVNKFSLGSAQDARSTTNNRSHTDNRTTTVNESESEGGSLSRTISRMLGKAKALSTSHSHTEGGSESEALTVSQKWVHLARVIREEQMTGTLEKSVADQLEQIAQRIMTLKRRQALVLRPGDSRSVLIETNEVKDPFESPEALIRAVDWMKKELTRVHDYYFVPDLTDEGRSLADFLGEDVEEADEPVVLGAAAVYEESGESPFSS